MFENELKSLGRMAERARERCKNHGRIEYPKRFKKKVVQLLNSGVSNYKIGEVCGIHFNTAYKWKNQFISIKGLSVDNDENLPVVNEKPTKKEVQQIECKDESDIKITLPNGIIIQSNDCNELLKILTEFKDEY